MSEYKPYEEYAYGERLLITALGITYIFGLVVIVGGSAYNIVDGIVGLHGPIGLKVLLLYPIIMMVIPTFSLDLIIE